MNAGKQSYSLALRTGLLELLIVLAGLIFVRREVYMQWQFSSLVFHWQDYALLGICFFDGIVHGAFDLQGPAKEISPFRTKESYIGLPFILFLYVSCAALCVKLNVATLNYEWLHVVGLAIMLLAIGIGLWARRTVPACLLNPEGDNKELPAELTLPWRQLRYPERFALLFMLFGMSFVLSSWMPILALPGVFIALKWELADIEAFRIREIGDPYLAYRKESWSLLPFIY